MKSDKFTEKVFDILVKNAWHILSSTDGKAIGSEQFRQAVKGKRVKLTTIESDIIEGSSSNWRVRRYADNTYSCTCPFFVKQLKGSKPCHHLLLYKHRIIRDKFKRLYQTGLINFHLDLVKACIYVPDTYRINHRKLITKHMSVSEADLFYNLIKAGWTLQDLKIEYNINYADYSGYSFISHILKTTSDPTVFAISEIKTCLEEN